MLTTSSPTPQSILESRFGYSTFRQGQQQVIETLLAGRSAAAIFPTGAGKSLCYQLPSLLFEGMTLVVSPLLALMKDQIDGLRAKGIAAERLDSTLDENAYRDVTKRIESGQIKLLFIAPERLSNERFLNLIRQRQISLLAVDEAHCISAWGHNFRPDYLKLARTASELNVERILALTATATPQVATDIAEGFQVAAKDVVNTGFYRPNLELRVTACQDSGRPALLARRLGERPAGPTIVYVSLQRHAEEVASALEDAGFKAAPYHAGLAAEQREATQEAFMQGEIPIICATIAFGMGVDKADIRYIYHYHLPKGYESYMQEIGRAGRDGQPSICELFACPDDCTILENFVYGDTPDEVSLRGIIDELLGAGDLVDISVADLARRHDMRQLVVATLLTRLEIMEVLRSEGHYYGNIRFTPLVSSKEILAQYNQQQAAFLRQLFSCCSKAVKWVTLDMDKAITITGNKRDVILRALDSLHTNGLIQLQLAGYRQRYRRLTNDLNQAQIQHELSQSFTGHEKRELERITAMLDYAGHAGCLTGKLLEYFGESVTSCGHCGNCKGDQYQPLATRRKATVNESRLGGFQALAADYPEALGRPRQQARYLCGLNSPAVSAQRQLRGNPLFGKLRNVPFAEVLSWCKDRSAVSQAS